MRKEIVTVGEGDIVLASHRVMLADAKAWAKGKILEFWVTVLNEASVGHTLLYICELNC